jgi:predicted Zn-dependent protease
MTDPSFGSETGFHVADQLRRLKVPGPWEVLGEQVERYEVHFLGSRPELLRSPLRVGGVGIRLFRPDGDAVRVGYAATSDLAESSIRATVEDAEASARHARFPAPCPELPSSSAGAPSVSSADRAAWESPQDSMEAFSTMLVDAMDGRGNVRPSFGSLSLNLAETTLANSAGLAHRASRTEAALEFALTASGGPEGRPPGEYWAPPQMATRLDASALAVHVDDWCRKAEEIRRAEPLRGGPQSVVLPPRVLADVLPAILGFRFSGAAAMRQIAPAPGDVVAAEGISLVDDGLLPRALGSSSLDTEGIPQRRRALIQKGACVELLRDLLHGSVAGGTGSSGNGLRYGIEYAEPAQFTTPPGTVATTLVVTPGDLGSDVEIAEVAHDGIWVDQLGYAFPDGLSGAFGGELRLGYRIQNGRIGGPVHGGTIGGLALAPPGTPSLLGGVIGIGRTTARPAHLDTPAIVSNGLTVAGAG